MHSCLLSLLLSIHIPTQCLLLWVLMVPFGKFYKKIQNTKVKAESPGVFPTSIQWHFFKHQSTRKAQWETNDKWGALCPHESNFDPVHARARIPDVHHPLIPQTLKTPFLNKLYDDTTEGRQNVFLKWRLEINELHADMYYGSINSCQVPTVWVALCVRSYEG